MKFLKTLKSGKNKGHKQVQLTPGEYDLLDHILVSIEEYEAREVEADKEWEKFCEDHEKSSGWQDEYGTWREGQWKNKKTGKVVNPPDRWGFNRIPRFSFFDIEHILKHGKK